MAGVTVGAVAVLPLSDGDFVRPATRFFPDVPAAAWDAYRAEHLDAEGNLRLNLGSFLLRADGMTLLVDTGIGPNPRPGENNGRLLDDLRAAGVTPEAVDAVLTTHMHFDHIGWNTVARDGSHVPTFPRARYFVQAEEWAYWTQPAGEAAPHVTDPLLALLDRVAVPLERTGQLELVQGEHPVSASVRFLPTPGHTPGHACILIDSAGEGAVILGDLAHTPAQVGEPDWPDAADLDTAQGSASRRAVWERVEAHGLTICAGHFPRPGLGRIVPVTGKRSWRAL